MEWHELSEVNFGLILENRREVTMYKPEYFDAPYDRGVEVLMKKGATREDVAKVLNSSYISDAHDSVHKWNGVGDKENFDWTQALIDAFLNYQRGVRFEKLGRKMKTNEQVDLLPVYSDLSSAIAGKDMGLRPLSQIDISDYKPFMESGDPVHDKILGNFPNDGPIVAYGKTGVGKSFWLASKVDYFLQRYPQKRAAIYTLEMGEEHWKHRNLKMYPSLSKVEDRLHVSGVVSTIEQIVSEVMTKKFDFVGIDDIDNLVQQNSAEEYERVYRKIKEICRFMKIPVCVLAQPNRMAKLSDGFLGPYDIAWSGAAENSAALLVALQKTNSLDIGDGIFPTEDEDMYYQICYKSRDGWPVMQGPGAIILTKSKQLWRGTPYGNKYKLWLPGRQTIGKKRKEEK
jgi:hypothetical protein